MLPSGQVTTGSTQCANELLCKAVVVLKTQIGATFCTFDECLVRLAERVEAMQEKLLRKQVIFWHLRIPSKPVRWSISTISFLISIFILLICL